MINIENVLESNIKDNKKYLCYINGEDLYNLFIKGELVYNDEIQRGKIIKKVKGSAVLEPIAVPKKIDNIYKDMIRGEFYESTIVLNIPKGVNSRLENGSLAIYGELDILDGYHRLSALKEYSSSRLVEYRDYSIVRKMLRSFNYPVEITNLSTEEAKNKFYQLTLGAKIATSRAQYFNSQDPTNEIIKSLMKEGNELYQRVETTKNVIPKRSLERVVTFSTLVTAINKNIDLGIMVTEEIMAFEEFLNVFFGELLTLWDGFCDDDLRAREAIMNMQYDNFMFHGYVALAVYLWNTYPETKEGEYGNAIKDLGLLKEINFSKDNEIWKDVISVRKPKDKVIYGVLNNISTRKIISTILIREFKILKNIEQNEQILNK